MGGYACVISILCEVLVRQLSVMQSDCRPVKFYGPFFCGLIKLFYDYIDEFVFRVRLAIRAHCCEF